MQRILFTTVLFWSIFTIQAQQTTTAFKVFLDYFSSPLSSDFLKDETRFVDYVSDRRLADIQVWIIGEPVGNSSMRFQYYFNGNNAFAGLNDTVVWHIETGENDGSIRAKSLLAYKQGLLTYLLKTPWAASLSYTVDAAPDNADTYDPWNRWTFNPELDASFFQLGYKDSNGLTGDVDNKRGRTLINSSFNIWRIGRRWRFMNSWRYQYYNQYYRTLSTRNSSPDRNLNVNLAFVYSLGKHWSTGLSTSVVDISPKYPANTKISPGIEYDVFSYERFFHKRLLIGYYYDQALPNTDYGTPSVNHNLYLIFAQTSNWGYYNLNANFGYDFNNSYWNSAIYSGGFTVGINLLKNFYLRMVGSFTYGNYYNSVAGISGPIVFSKKARSTDMNLNLGVDYYFGSGYRNIINPRMTRL